VNIFQIALKNIKRRKRKMSFVVVGLVVGVATVVALINIIQAMRMELGNELDKFGPNIVITPRFQDLGLDYGGSQVAEVMTDVKPLTAGDLPLIRAIPDGDSVNIISPKLVGAVMLSQRKALLVGVETKSEFAMKPWFSLRELTGQMTGKAPSDLALLDLPDNGLILGSGIAGAYSVHAGDEMTVNDTVFTVTGILNEMGTEEDGLAYANLPVVQDLLGRPGIFSMIEVSGFCNFCPIEEMAEQMTAVLPNGRVTALRQAALIREETISRFSAFGFILSGVVLLVAALVVMTTMLSSVNERKHEIGIFRAIGFRRLHILEIIELEALMVSLLSGIIGYLAGSVTARAAGPYLAQMQVSIPWNPILIIPAILISIGIAAMASLVPAVKAANLDPVDALKSL
jgi:putative ABC transport system permease protein